MNGKTNNNGQVGGETVNTFLGKFLSDDLTSIKIVTFGGFLGGLLQPAVAQLNSAQANPVWSNWLLGPVLGVAAAGITVFVLANSNTQNKMRLLFFSLLCGLAFPTVLTTAVEGVSPGSEEVELGAERIAKKAISGNSDSAATELAKIMLENPTSGDIDRAAEAQLQSTADTVVSNLSDKAGAGGGASADKAIEQLKQIGTAARSAGYDGTALLVTEELKKIEANAGTGADQKEDAGDAANDIIGVSLLSPPTK